MARIDLYLSDDEKEFVKAQPTGFVRELVRDAMDLGLPRNVVNPHTDATTDRWTRQQVKSPEQYRREKEAK